MVSRAQIADGIETRFDFGAIERGPQQALAQQAAAHAGRGLIEHGRSGCAAAAASREDRVDQFEIAHGDGVEHHGFGAVEIASGGSR